MTKQVNLKLASMRKIQKSKQGFTLFEVLIALAILSIAMVAGMLTTDVALNRTLSIEKKILAHWVGMNILNSMELKLLKNKLSEAESLTDSGSLTIRNQSFLWQLKTEKKVLDAANLSSVQVTVYDTQDNSSNKNNINPPLDVVSRNVFIY